MTSLDLLRNSLCARAAIGTVRAPMLCAWRTSASKAPISFSIKGWGRKYAFEGANPWTLKTSRPGETWVFETPGWEERVITFTSCPSLTNSSERL